VKLKVHHVGDRSAAFVFSKAIVEKSEFLEFRRWLKGMPRSDGIRGRRSPSGATSVVR
jgi:hypothetical protein